MNCPLCSECAAEVSRTREQAKRQQKKVRLIRKALKAHYAVLDHDTVTRTGLSKWLIWQRKNIRRALAVKR